MCVWKSWKSGFRKSVVLSKGLKDYLCLASRTRGPRTECLVEALVALRGGACRRLKVCRSFTTCTASFAILKSINARSVSQTTPRKINQCCRLRGSPVYETEWCPINIPPNTFSYQSATFVFAFVSPLELLSTLPMKLQHKLSSLQRLLQLN